jgi:hypothetical protein
VRLSSVLNTKLGIAIYKYLLYNFVMAKATLKSYTDETVAVNLATPGRTPRGGQVQNNGIAAPAPVSTVTQMPVEAALQNTTDVPQTEMTTTTVVQATPVQQNVVYKSLPVRNAVVSVLSVGDTPRMRADKIRAMADAADAHAKLYDYGITNNDFLMVNEVAYTQQKNVASALEKSNNPLLQDINVGETLSAKPKTSKKVKFFLGLMTIIAIGAVGYIVALAAGILPDALKF